MTVVRGAVVPHAPLLLPELESPEVSDAARVLREAISSLEMIDVDAIVVVSPHGARTGVYSGAAGSLAPFGVPGDDRWWFSPPDLSREIAQAWGRPALDGPVDHGVFVGLSLLGDVRGSVVAVALSEDDASGADTIDLVQALEAVDARLFVIASANLSAALTQRAPLTYRSESEEIESRVVAALDSDPGPLMELAPELATRGGSCSASTLQLFGRMFSGGRSRLVAYEKPVGVGYPVAVAGPR